MESAEKIYKFPYNASWLLYVSCAKVAIDKIGSSWFFTYDDSNSYIFQFQMDTGMLYFLRIYMRNVHWIVAVPVVIVYYVWGSEKVGAVLLQFQTPTFNFKGASNKSQSRIAVYFFTERNSLYIYVKNDVMGLNGPMFCSASNYWFCEKI